MPLSQIQLPNCLFIEAPGCGVTTHIRMLADLLQELRLISSGGGRRYFEFVLDENAFRSEADGFQRLLNRRRPDSDKFSSTAVSTGPGAHSPPATPEAAARR